MTRAVSLVVMALLGAGCDLVENRQVHPLVESGQTPPGNPGYGGYGNGYGGYQGGSEPARGLGGSYGGGGAGGNASIGCSKSTAELCVYSCSFDLSSARSPMCDPNTGTWSCPLGWFDSTVCPPGTCAYPDYGYCCNRLTGISDRPACGADGTRQPCATGTTATPTSQCIPSGFGVSSCSELSGQPCFEPRQQCSDNPIFCQCLDSMTDAAALYAWSCRVF